MKTIRKNFYPMFYILFYRNVAKAQADVYKGETWRIAAFTAPWMEKIWDRIILMNL